MGKVRTPCRRQGSAHRSYNNSYQVGNYSFKSGNPHSSVQNSGENLPFNYVDILNMPCTPKYSCSETPTVGINVKNSFVESNPGNFSSHVNLKDRTSCATMSDSSTIGENSECLSFDESFADDLKLMINNPDHDRVNQYGMDVDINTDISTSGVRHNVRADYSWKEKSNEANEHTRKINGPGKQCSKVKVHTNGSQNCSLYNNKRMSSLDLTDNVSVGAVSNKVQSRIPYSLRNVREKDYSKSFPPYNGASKANKKVCHRKVKSYTTLSSDMDVETDTFYAKKVETCQPTSVPPGVKPEFDRLGGYRRKLTRSWFPLFPAKKFPCSPAYIQHTNATDNPELGDKFGAYVRTNTSAEKEGYYRHFFCKIEHGSPANTMKIEEEDEIVLINERFVPDLNHDQIMALITRVPVDGITRFKLVLRRLKGDAWEWFETSAILVPELLEEPRARDVKLTLLKNNMYDKTTYHRYNVIGTQLYVDISDHAVSVGVLTGDPRRDNTKTICKHTMVCTDKRYPPRIIYISSLGNADKCCFLTINETTNQAFITTKESFFEYKTLGSQIYFKQNDVYLSCVNKKVCATKEMQMFDEMPTPGHRDIPDVAPESCNNMDIDMLDGAGPTTPPCSGPKLGSRTSPYNSLGVVGAIAKPRNSSFDQAGVTNLCNNTEDMLDCIGANSSPFGTPRTPPYCGDTPRRASRRNGTGYSSINNGDIGVTGTINGTHGISGARIRGGNGDVVNPPEYHEVAAAFCGNLGRKRSHDEMNKRDSGYGTASPWDTPPRRVTRSLSKQLSVTSLFGEINLD